MKDMGQHREITAPLRRARFAAWAVFVVMAATTMTFQVYHSLRYGEMPWLLAYLEGIVPLAIALGILEFVSKWDNAPWWATAGAYLIMAGAMYLSAASTGAVVLHAAPPHMSWVFGLLMDGAALLAVHFILNGPSAAAAAAAAAERETAMQAAADAAQAALDAEIRALGERLTAAGTECEGVRGELAEATARAQDAEAARAQAEADRRARETAEAELGAARGELAAAVARADAADAKADRLARRLGGPKGRSAGGTRSRGTAARTGPETGTGTGTGPGTAPDDDLALEARALELLATDLTMTGAELARRLGVTEGYGRKLRRRLTQQDRLVDEVTDRPGPDREDRPGDRTEDRS